MPLDKYDNGIGRKWVVLTLITTAVFITSFYWYANKSTNWHYEDQHRCNQVSGIKNDSSKQQKSEIMDMYVNQQNGNKLCWDLSKRVNLDRMMYDKPEVTKPKRSDVMTVTPWLAPIVWNGIYNIDILNAQHHKRDTRIGLSVFVIRKYVRFIGTFLETAEKFFMVGHPVNYYVFTDQPGNITYLTLGQKRRLIVLEVPSYKRWQDITMRRMQIIRDQVHNRFINEIDYLVCVDVDMKFTDHVGVEILGDVFGAIHPGFFTVPRREFTNERRPESAGYIPEDEGDFYYTGCFFGGNLEEIYKLTNHCHHAMLADKEKNMEALWHDESYLNRYFLYYKPTKVLSPEYVWNYYYGDPAVVQKKRFIVVPKDYAVVRDRRALS